jgi:hypothetical protein
MGDPFDEPVLIEPERRSNRRCQRAEGGRPRSHAPSVATLQPMS